MAVAYKATGTRFSSAGATSVSGWTLPTRAAGDILIAMVCSKNNATHNWSGTGWTKIGQQNSGASFTVSWGWKLSDGTDALPTVSWTGSVAAGATISSWSGASAVGPLQVAYNSGTTSTHAGTDTAPPRVGRVIYAEMSAANTALATPTNFTEHNDAGSATGATRNTIGSRALAEAAASGTASATGASAAWARMTFSLIEPVAAFAADVGAFTLAGQAATTTYTPVGPSLVSFPYGDAVAYDESPISTDWFPQSAATLTDGVSDPTGGSGAMRIASNDATSMAMFGRQAVLYESNTYVNGQTYTFEIIARAYGATQFLRFCSYDSGKDWGFIFDLTDGTVASARAGGGIEFDPTVVDLGSGWYCLQFCVAGDGTGWNNHQIAPTNTDSTDFDAATVVAVGDGVDIFRFQTYPGPPRSPLTGTAPTRTTKLDSYKKASSLTLSGGDLIATATTNADVSAGANNAITGKKYWEVVAAGTGTYRKAGIALASHDWTTNLEAGTAVIVAGVDGYIYVGSSQGAAIGGYGDGARLCFAVDDDAKLFWVRLGTTGDWNGNPSANPATGTGGFDYSGFSGFSAGTVYPAVGTYESGTSWTAYFATASWSGTAPSGFTTLDPVAGGAYTLTANAGSFALAGQAASTLYHRNLVADVRAFSLAGVAASTLYHRSVGGGVGAYALAGQAASTLYHRSVGGGVGAFTMSGIAAGTFTTRVLTAAVGTFTLAGQDAAFSKGFGVIADRGQFALSGVDAAFRRDYVLAAGVGSFALSGQQAALVKTGNYVLLADTGAFALSGKAATVGRAMTLPAAAGSFALAGQAATLLRHRYAVAAAGSFALSGKDAALTAIAAARTLTAETGAFTFTGRDAALAYSRAVQAAVGSFGLAGQAVTLSRVRTLTAGAGAFAVDGKTAALLRAYLLEASWGAYSALGQDARLVGPQWTPRPPAAGSWASATPSDGTWTPATPAAGSWSEGAAPSDAWTPVTPAGGSWT